MAALYARCEHASRPPRVPCPPDRVSRPGPVGDCEVVEGVRQRHGAGAMQGLLSNPDDSSREFTLARWCADFTWDAEQIERIMRGLGFQGAREDPEKWERRDYLPRTIARAIASAQNWGAT